MEFELTPVDDERALALAQDVRRQVFIAEQNVPEDVELDDLDDVAYHVLCIAGGTVVGTGRVLQTKDGAKIGRVAVLKRHRGKGAGTAIVSHLVERARKKGEKNIYANVQLEAVPFYKKLGFVGSGEHFYEGGIEHIRMYLKA